MGCNEAHIGESSHYLIQGLFTYKRQDHPKQPIQLDLQRESVLRPLPVSFILDHNPAGLYTGYSWYNVVGSLYSSHVSTGKAGGLSANSDA